MTFDFAPNWLDSLSTDADLTPPVPRAPVLSALRMPLAPPPGPPAPPTMTEVAELVGELFTEGTLSFEQLCSLSHAPELGSLLDDTIANVAPRRRAATAR